METPANQVCRKLNLRCQLPTCKLLFLRLYSLDCYRNSQKEHLFEVTLPSPTFVGHLDLKVLLHSGCAILPTIEATLYRISKKRRVSSNEVDSGIDFASQLKNKTSIELFLKSVGAEVVCGPLDTASFMDVSCQSANVVMTSPKLILSKTRNFYLHIRAKLPLEMPGGPPSEKVILNSCSFFKSSK